MQLTLKQMQTLFKLGNKPTTSCSSPTGECTSGASYCSPCVEIGPGLHIYKEISNDLIPEYDSYYIAQFNSNQNYNNYFDHFDIELQDFYKHLHACLIPVATTTFILIL
jgi:hypothetical protein